MARASRPAALNLRGMSAGATRSDAIVMVDNDRAHGMSNLTGQYGASTTRRPARACAQLMAETAVTNSGGPSGNGSGDPSRVQNDQLEATVKRTGGRDDVGASRSLIVTSAAAVAAGDGGNNDGGGALRHLSDAGDGLEDDEVFSDAGTESTACSGFPSYDLEAAATTRHQQGGDSGRDHTSSGLSRSRDMSSFRGGAAAGSSRSRLRKNLLSFRVTDGATLAPTGVPRPSLLANFLDAPLACGNDAVAPPPSAARARLMRSAASSRSAFGTSVRASGRSAAVLSPDAPARCIQLEKGGHLFGHAVEEDDMGCKERERSSAKAIARSDFLAKRTHAPARSHIPNVDVRPARPDYQSKSKSKGCPAALQDTHSRLFVWNKDRVRGYTNELGVVENRSSMFRLALMSKP